MGILETLRTLFSSAGAAPEAGQARAIELIEQGNALEETGELGKAAQCYEAALRVAPTLPRAHLNRGNILLAMGDVTGAVAAYRSALIHDPGYIGGHFNLGNALLRSNLHDEGLASYAKAIELDPHFVDAHIATGVALEDLGRPDAAIASYQSALVLQPTLAPLHSNLGGALQSAGRFVEAVQSHRQALALDATLVQAHNNLGSVMKDLAALDEAEASYRQALALQPDSFDARSNLLFLHNYRAKYSPAQLLAEARAFGELATRRARRNETWRGTPDLSRELQIGLVSGDLRNHPVGYFVESVVSAFAATGTDRMSLTAYVTAHCDDSISQAIRSNCRRWREMKGMSDEALAGQIHGDAIDILIDLSGHTAHNRLAVFAWKPAPVQVSWLGYFATTGVVEIDHLIGDPWTLPESEAVHFTENIWRLPQTRLCFSVPERSPLVNDLPAATHGAVTFGCFNNVAKVTEEVVAVWARVLIAVPRSRLLLKSPPLREPELRQALIDKFAAHGIDADRLTLEGLSSREDYLARYGQVDIALDPFPFPGGTTSVESMWMGVPVLTMSGESFLARQGLGLLMTVGLPAWIAADAADYVRLAAKHAADLATLAELRAGLRQRMLASPLMDAPRFAAHLQDALRGMWQQHCARRLDATAV